MKVPALIDFTDIHERVIFKPDTAEYKAMMALNTEGTWKEYQNEQLGNGVSVRYDQSSDVFAVQPDRFSNNELKEAHGFDSLEDNDEDDGDLDIDIESDDDVLGGLVDDEPAEIEEPTSEEPIADKPTGIVDSAPEPDFPEFTPNNEPSNNSSMQISLDDVMAVLQQIMNNTSAPAVTMAPAESTVPQIPATTAPDSKGNVLEGGPEALKKVFFQGDGNETLDSDFDVLYDNIQNLESHTNPESSYVNVINGTAKIDGTVEQPGLKGIDMAADSTISNTVIEPQAEIVDMITSTPAKYGIDQDPGYYEDIENGLQGPDRLVQDLPGSDLDEPGYDYDQEDKGLLLDIKEDDDTEDEETMTEGIGEDEDVSSMMEDGEYKNPDLDRFGTTADYSPEEETFEADFSTDDVNPAFEEPQTPAITANKKVNLGGQQVQIILTGVMITVPEIQYIGESVKKAGNRLKQIKGKGNELNIVVEANDQQYTINYVEQERNKTKTPFSIKKMQFQSLEEALNRINYTRGVREAEVFEKIIGSDIMSRELNNINEATIFDGFENINHVSSWSVRHVGALNLKNGLNETYSKITQDNDEPNTLVRDEKNNYYLIKGNLKERSKVGTMKELVDFKTKRTIGNAEVVGLYENTQKGLGEIMYKIKMTAIPLLVWK